MANPRVLLVEDDQAVRHGLSAFLRANGILVDEAETCRQARASFRPGDHEVVIADYSLPDGTSLDFLPDVKRLSEDTPFVILTAHGSIDLAVRAIKEGAEQFLTKPVDAKTLLVLVQRLARQHQLRRSQALAARERPGVPDPFLGESNLIRELEQQARRMLEWDSPVLILGETGSGKGVLARWLHANGPRADEAFVNVNCAGLSRELLESELFGYERGAFTGAVTPKQGLLEVGHRGIVFLDEIGDMDMAIQPKLLKALEEKSFRRLGAVVDRQVDIRLLASTNLDLEELVRTRRFRDDLYYRVSTLTLRIPALRERKEDIPLLADSILRGIAARMGKLGVRIDADAVRALQAYHWPGNIRELANVIERAMILQRGERLRAEDLGLGSRAHTPSGQPEDALSLREVERLHIERVLRRTGGNVTEAAAILGIARRTLYDRLRTLGIPAHGK
ncbi:MAG TPA: sigma-54 dependent transcriptional regulator [Thermoanaerobaculaceae bacterium]|nr:sigma-54 dependent transcriptional regulator [Thermoanaerobaculaceae bacterium]HRS15125.1 sigma-54 dependent transcriptional regulator [Thermoanaerobaculaceae bacterium]